MKKALSFVLVAAMLITTLVVSVSAAAWDGTTVSASLKGEGTAASPYLVESAADLAFLAKSVNEGTDYAGKYITQTADIDLGGKEWTPIGTSAKPFCGVYNGLGYKITGLSITKVHRFLGLFGYVKGTTADAGIANLKLEGSININDAFASAADAGVGALVGWIYQDGNEPTHRVKIINVTTDVDVTLKGVKNKLRIGTVAGYVYCADFENVVNNGNMTVDTTSEGRVGGMVGQGNRSTYVNCVNNGNVTVDASNAGTNFAAAAGFQAVTTVKHNNGTPIGVAVSYKNCVNNGDIKLTTASGVAYAAGFVGNPYHGGTGTTNYFTVDSCVNTGDIFGKRTDAADYVYAGGLVAYNNKADVAITNSVNSGTVTIEAGEKSNPGGIVGVMNAPNVATAYLKDCITTGKLAGYIVNAKDGCTADAEAAAVTAAAKVITDKLAPSTTKIAGFDTAYKAPVTPTPTPNPGTGDATVAVVLLATVALFGIGFVTKKVSAR